MDFRVLGPIEVLGDAGTVPLGGEKPRALLAALMLRRGRAVTTDALVHAAWERPPPTVDHAVAVYFSRLRAAIAGAKGDRQPIVTSRNGYALEIDADELDLERFRRLAARGRAAAAAREWDVAWTTLGEALNMWRQTTALACLTTSPLTEARRELEDERLCALEDRLDAALQLGLHGDVLSEVRALTCEHPERERLWATLMLALYRSGRQAESLDTYLVARTELDAAFGIEPGLALRELQRRILEQDAALDPPDASSAPVSLPFPPSSFVGRTKELEDAIELLSDGNVRLVTVIGPGGIGKSRFAIELARRSAKRFPDGVTWVGLDALDDPARVLPEVAAAVGAGTPTDPLDAVNRELREKRVLLVLDCFEHVLDAATDIHHLLARVAMLRVVVTSRERLGLSGEHLFWLPPLQPNDAAELFRARSGAVSRSTPPSDEAGGGRLRAAR